MSHEIDETTGKAAVAYVGETPWHGLGQQVPKGASIEEIEQAGGELELFGDAAHHERGTDRHRAELQGGGGLVVGTGNRVAVRARCGLTEKERHRVFDRR